MKFDQSESCYIRGFSDEQEACDFLIRFDFAGDNV